MKYCSRLTPCLLLLTLSAVFSIVSSTDAMAAAAVQRRVQMQKAAQQQMMQQYQQQMIAQRQAQEMAAYQQAMGQRQAIMQQQVANQRAAAEYAAYKQAMQQAMAQKQAQAQQIAAYQQAVAQKQAEELAMYQKAKQAVAQKQAAEVAAVQQSIAYKRTSEMAGYRQAVETKQAIQAKTQFELNQEIKQYADFLAKRNAAQVAQGVQAQQVQAAQELAMYNQYQQVRVAQTKAAVATKLQTQAAQKAIGAKMARDVLESKAEHERRAQEGAEPVESETVVDIKDLWQALEVSSEPWGQIIDNEIKALTVAEYIDRFKKVGIGIEKAPGHYVKVIDTVAEQDPAYLGAPFMNVLSYAAIVEYDFDNGQNKDELARKVLGEANFKSNKARLQQR